MSSSTPLPRLGLTGIGSLPFTDVDRALAYAFAHEVPFWPQLPAVSASDLMLPLGLEGVPGALGAQLDFEIWQSQRDSFGERVEQALSSGALSQFEPQASPAWQPFLDTLRASRPRWAKVQLVGPATLKWWAKTTAGERAESVPALDLQLGRLCLAKALALVAAVTHAGVRPVLFLDEPGLVSLDVDDARHRLVLDELRLVISAAQKAGAVVGLHCCGNTRWAAVTTLGIDVISFDARLSLDAFLEETTVGDAWLALGVVPTEEHDLPVLLESVEASLRASTKAYPRALERMLLTPACGLAGKSEDEADRVLAELRSAAANLR